ncbi:DUF397 domain-containing protein [Streptomyces sp. NPDC047024]|uniref:DUF397 domain-containing protein n=1 Tax=Streptomyces sp. NPDC047024 TaxID=3155476 RepID=UPI0033DF6FD8
MAMNDAESATAVWFKSSHSGAEGGQCVEVTRGTVAMHIRDSKTSTGPVLTVSASAWTEFIGLTWHKSSRSGAEGGECVEVAAAPAAVHIRDSKDTAGPVLTVSLGAWTKFIDPAWHKSTYSGTEGGQCVEIAAGPGAVRIRDSKATARPALTVSPAAWTEFVGAVSPT